MALYKYMFYLFFFFYNVSSNYQLVLNWRVFSFRCKLNSRFDVDEVGLY